MQQSLKSARYGAGCVVEKYSVCFLNKQIAPGTVHLPQILKNLSSTKPGQYAVFKMTTISPFHCAEIPAAASCHRTVHSCEVIKGYVRYTHVPVLPMAKDRLGKKVKKHVWDPTDVEIELKLRKGPTKVVLEKSACFSRSLSCLFAKLVSLTLWRTLKLWMTTNILRCYYSFRLLDTEKGESWAVTRSPILRALI